MSTGRRGVNDLPVVEVFEDVNVNTDDQRMSGRRSLSKVVLYGKRSHVKLATDPSNVRNAKL